MKKQDRFPTTIPGPELDPVPIGGAAETELETIETFENSVPRRRFGGFASRLVSREVQVVQDTMQQVEPRERSTGSFVRAQNAVLDAFAREQASRR